MQVKDRVSYLLILLLFYLVAIRTFWPNDRICISVHILEVILQRGCALKIGSCYCDSRFLGSAVALDRPLVAAIATVNFFCMYLGTQRLQFSTLRVHHRPWDANQCPAERTLRVVSLRETPLVWRCISCFKGNIIIWHNLTWPKPQHENRLSQ